MTSVNAGRILKVFSRRKTRSNFNVKNLEYLIRPDFNNEEKEKEFLRRKDYVTQNLVAGSLEELLCYYSLLQERL